MPVIGAAAATKHVRLVQMPAQLAVLRGQLLRIAVVQFLRLVSRHEGARIVPVAARADAAADNDRRAADTRNDPAHS